MTVGAATTACLALAAATAPLGRAALVGLEQAVGACRELSVDFIVLEGEANLLVLEDDIRADLAEVGITVNLRALPKDEFNAAMVSGDFNMAFSETWGPPYDPHSYAASWSTPDEAYFAALEGLPPPITKEVLTQKIADVLKVEDEAQRQAGWTEILSTLHDQATELPFSGKRIPAVISRRLAGYTPGQQQFDYPLHTLRVLSGERTVTVAPGAQTGLFTGVGRLDPHSYRPNEFFANNFVYDGLVEYGPGGAILPSLAVSWDVDDLDSGGQQYTFTLRTGVVFHDGAPWDCAAAKLNFDHVLAPPLTTGDWHGWYGLPGAIDGWRCEGDHTFVVTTKSVHYPLLQELSFIRPLRMLSPTMFVAGYDSDPLTQNSCPTGWGSWSHDGVEITCAGAPACRSASGAPGAPGAPVPRPSLASPAGSRALPRAVADTPCARPRARAPQAPSASRAPAGGATSRIRPCSAPRATTASGPSRRSSSRATPTTGTPAAARWWTPSGSSATTATRTSRARSSTGPSTPSSATACCSPRPSPSS